MKFSEIIEHAKALLQRQGRLTYRSLKREFDLEDEALEDLKFELIEGQELAVDKDGKMLVWIGEGGKEETTKRGNGEEGLASSVQRLEPDRKEQASSGQTLDARLTAGERRQLTVMFCDLVDSTALSEQLDPEEYGEVVRAYQHTSTAVIERFEGYIAQYLGDGLLVYFGYPQAHEDDAARAVRAGLEIVEAIREQGAGNRLQKIGKDIGAQHSTPLQVRIGVHTGPVVISEIGSSGRHEQLALGETPNISARVQGQADPNAVVISATTYQLVQGLFECQELDARPLKGLSTSLSLYQVVREAVAHSRFEVAIQRGLTPLVGREHEVGLLSERWERAKQAEGQVVLLSGEPGIGKSRLVEVMREQAENDAALRLEFRCSPYHQNSAFYPTLDHLYRLLQFDQCDSAAERLGKLEQMLTSYQFPQADTVPLLAALLSLPHPEKYPAINVSPQRQKQKTQEVLVAWLVEEAGRHALYCPWEDLHWADPSTLELLTLLIEQVPTARLYLILTFRPEFTPPWGTRSHISHLTLSRLGRGQVTQMIERVAGERALPTEMLQQIVTKTDGVPLFVEELTKSVVESVGALREAPLRLEIPATLQDSLMARLDRLGAAKEIAQLGATLGREFSHELLRAISPLDEEALQRGLSQLVDAELMYQRGVLPHRQYIFKHALIQDAAYQSLLKSRRQQLHQQITHVLEERFPEIKATQPELLAHHYTEAGLIEQAIPYWQKAGERASQSSAHVEAITHLTKGLEALKTLPDSSERRLRELKLQMTLGVTLQATKGFAAPEVERVYARALELCGKVGDTPQLFSALWGSWVFYNIRGELETSRELAARLLSLAQEAQDDTLLLEAHHSLWFTTFLCGELTAARSHSEQGISLYDRQQHHSLTFLYGGHDPGVCCRNLATVVLWLLGYPDQAYTRSQEALALARELSHPFSLSETLTYTTWLFQFRREEQMFHEQTEAMMALAEEQGFSYSLAHGTLLQGWALVWRGQGEEGIARMRRGLTALRATGAESFMPYYLVLLAEAYGKVEQTAEGLSALTEALEGVNNNRGARFYEAELYRIKGTLTLQSQVLSPKSQVQEAEACFLKAVDITRKQQAKSLELRAATSLARLWQSQGKRTEAHQMLSEIYNWFTEGFATKDLQEAKVLLDELSD